MQPPVLLVLVLVLAACWCLLVLLLLPPTPTLLPLRYCRWLPLARDLAMILFGHGLRNNTSVHADRCVRGPEIDSFRHVTMSVQ